MMVIPAQADTPKKGQTKKTQDDASKESCVECTCKPYLSFLKEYDLASQVSDVGAAALHREGREFAADDALGRALKLRIQDDERIPQECRDFVASNVRYAPKVSVGVRRVVGPDGNIPFTYDGMGLMKLYRNTQFALTGCTGGEEALRSCVRTNGAQAYQQLDGELSKSTADVRAFFQGFGTELSDEDATVLRAFHSFVSAGTEAELLKRVKSARGGLSERQFIKTVQMMGQQLNDGYDFQRINDGPTSEGAVSMDQMLAAARHNNELATFAKKALVPLAQQAGVCRDIAVLQGRMLIAGGLKAWVVAYENRDGAHAVPFAQSSDGTVYGLDYFTMAEKKGLDGGMALYLGKSAGITDRALKYRIYDPQTNKMVDVVPSEMQKFLTEAAGFDNRTQDQLSRPTSSMIYATYSPDKRGRLQLRLFQGNDGVGQSYAGLGASFGWGQGSLVPGKIGGVAATQQTPSEAYGTRKTGASVLLYAQAEQHVMTPKLRLGRDVAAQLDAHASVMALSQTTVGGAAKGLEGGEKGDSDFYGVGGVEARVELKSPDRRFSSTYRVGVTATQGDDDVQVSGKGGFSILPTGGYVGNRMALRVKDVTLMSDTMVVLDHLGARGRLEVGAAGRQVAASAHVSGRLTEGTSMLQDSAVRRVGFTVTAAPTQRTRISLTGEMPIEGDAPVGGLQVMGNAAVAF